MQECVCCGWGIERGDNVYAVAGGLVHYACLSEHLAETQPKAESGVCAVCGAAIENDGVALEHEKVHTDCLRAYTRTHLFGVDF